MVRVKNKRPKKVNAFATGLVFITMLVIFGFLLQSAALILDDNFFEALGKGVFGESTEMSMTETARD